MRSPALRVCTACKWLTIAPLAARHKDDNAIMNGRKLRHHRPVQVEGLYYPQDTDDSMGPTCVLPYSREPSIRKQLHKSWLMSVRRFQSTGSPTTRSPIRRTSAAQTT